MAVVTPASTREN